MKKTLSVGLVAFVAGAAFALYIVSPILEKEDLLKQDTVQIIERVIYEADGRVRKAQLVFPSWEQFYESTGLESQIEIHTDPLPATSGVSFSVQNMRWIDAIVKFVPDGYEAVKLSDREIKIRKKSK